MTGILDALKSLVRDNDVPVVEPAVEYPNEQAPDYWTDMSMSNGEASYVVPEHVTEADTFRPTNEVNVPFRGVVDHGVGVDEPSILVAPMPQELAEERRDIALKTLEETSREEFVVEPIPVVVRSMPIPTAQENRITPSRFDITNAVAVKLAPRRQQRSRVTFTATKDAQIMIGPTAEVVQGGYGFLVPVNGMYESNTTDEVWGIATAAGPFVAYVMEEYSVTVGEVAV